MLDHRTHALTITDAFEGSGRHRIEIPLHLAPGVTVSEAGAGRLVLRSGNRVFGLDWEPAGAWSSHDRRGTRVALLRGRGENRSTGLLPRGRARSRAHGPHRPGWTTRDDASVAVSLPDAARGDASMTSPALALVTAFAAVARGDTAVPRRRPPLGAPRPAERALVTPEGGAARRGDRDRPLGARRSLARAAGSGPTARARFPILLGGVALALIGLADDRAGLSAFTRLVAQLGVVGLVVLRVGGFERVPLPALLEHHLGPLGAAATVLWIVAVVNFYNFLDGIDGLAALQAVVTGAGILLAGWDPFAALLAAALVGAAAGFLPFNWSRASVFLGDIGSYFLGYTLAVLPLLAPPQLRSQAAVFVAVSLWLFLADATWTLVGRALRGERLYEAHREHLYQKLAQRWGHAKVTAAIGLGLDRPDRGGAPLVAQPGAAVGVGGVRPRPGSLRSRMEDGAIRRASRERRPGAGPRPSGSRAGAASSSPWAWTRCSSGRPSTRPTSCASRARSRSRTSRSSGASCRSSSRSGFPCTSPSACTAGPSGSRASTRRCGS